MRLIVFGATGGTGQQVMIQALAQGHRVTAVARRPEAVTFRAPQLRVVRGDVLHDATLPAIVADHDAVICALGTRHARQITTLYSAGTSNLLWAMHEVGLRRLVTVAAAAYVRDTVDPLVVRYGVKPLLNVLFGGAYADMQRMEARITASDTDWTIVRPTRLSDGPRTGTYRAVVDGAVPNGWRIARADVADYMLTQLEQPATYRTAVTLAY